MGRPGGKLLTHTFLGSRCIYTAPGAELGVFSAIDHLRHVAQSNGCAVAVGNNKTSVVSCLHKLVVGVDGVGTCGAVYAAFSRIGVGCRNRSAQRVKPQAIGGQRARVGLYAYRGPLAATESDQPYPIDLADFECQPRTHQVLHLGQRQRVRRDGKC